MRHGIHSFGKPQENSELRPKDVEHGPQLVDADVYRCTGSLSGCVDHAKCPAVLVESSCLPKLAISVRDASFHPEQVASSLLKAQKNHQCSCNLDHFGVVFFNLPIFCPIFFYFVQPEANTPVVRSGQATVHWPGDQKVQKGDCLFGAHPTMSIRNIRPSVFYS